MSRLSNMFAAKDMTQGTPWKQIALFDAPLLAGNIAQQFYNTADSLIVGRYVGDNALAAVGGSGPIINLLIVLFVGIATGAGIMVAQYFGARRYEDLSHAVGTCLTLTFISSLIMTALGILISEPLLRIMDTPPEIFDMCLAYLRIIFAGIIGSAFYNILAGILRGLGDSFSALKFLLLATVLNVFLDLLFVTKFNMAVEGVAIATIMAQFISAVMSLRKLLSLKDIIHMEKRHFALSPQYVKRLVSLGMPSGLAQAVMSCSSLVVQSLTNSFGAAFVACNTIVMRVDSFVMMPNFTFGNSMTTYTGQNIGAGKIERVEEGIRSGLKMAVSTACFLVLCILLFGRLLISFFTDTPYIIDMSVTMLRIIAFGYIAFAVTQCLSGVMRGAGDATTPMWISFFTTIVIRVPLAYLLAYLTRSAENPNGMPESVFISLLCSWIMGAVINAVAFKKGRWRKKAKAGIGTKKED